MSDYDDLEIGLYRQGAGSYAVELRFRRPDDETDRAPVRGVTSLDPKDLLEHQADLVTYGEKLASAVFVDESVRREFDHACTAAAAKGRKLRLRLLVDRSAPDLHGVRWELMCHPTDGSLLALSDKFLLSRFLTGNDWSQVHLRPKGALRALVAVASPDGLDRFPKLAPVDVEGELARARAVLGDSFIEPPLASGAAAAGDATDSKRQRVTLPALITALRRRYDILYLVCHGIHRERPTESGPPDTYLYLEKAEGGVDIVAGSQLVAALANLDPMLKPSLVILAACQSAGTSQTADEGMLAALGPRLAQEAAVPAVLAMQGNVGMDTVAAFMPEFFTQLAVDGQVDRALVAARTAVLDRSDWWTPTLFMRLRRGCLWYTPQLAGGGKGENVAWEDVSLAIESGRCTPILGPGLIDFLLGTPQETAKCWADAAGFPLAPDHERNLPQVARYLATTQSAAFPARQFAKHLRTELRRRHREILAGEPESADLQRLIRVVGQSRRQASVAEPFQILATLPIPIYITANPDGLLVDALREAGKDPQEAICPWYDGITQPEAPRLADPRYEPCAEAPLVYYLFGSLSQPDSLVLTEDDYFNFLIWVSKDRTRGAEGSKILKAVSKAWSANALLFLGFQVTDWDFRVLLHSIIDSEAGIHPKRHSSVAVQIRPEEGPFLQPERAARFLEQYLSSFRNSFKTNIYWGSHEDFIRELWTRVDGAQ
jgi:hypothetical protein